MSEIKIIVTEDGSHSLYHEGLKETYHSFHGALQESIHVFIEKGLRFWRTKSGLPGQMKVLEIGFGTGLNALLTANFATEHRVRIHYTTLEPFPVPKEIIEQLNYSSKVQSAASNAIFEALHAANWGERVAINDFFFLEKQQVKWEDFTPKEPMEVIFFDAFAPGKQAELWTLPVLEKCYSSMAGGGVFVTYSAKGQLKRDLKEAGFEVETLPGPPGKKEMVRAVKN